MKYKIKIKSIVSTIIFLLFALSMGTGISLYLAPSGKAARLSNWTFFGLNRTGLNDIHALASFALGILIVVHIILNIKLYLCEMRNLFSSKGRETAAEAENCELY